MVCVSLTLKETLNLEFVMTLIFLVLIMCTFQIDVLEAQNLLRQFSEELYEFIPSIPVRCRDIAIKVPVYSLLLALWF